MNEDLNLQNIESSQPVRNYMVVKYFAIFVFVISPFIGFWGGMEYQETTTPFISKYYPESEVFQSQEACESTINKVCIEQRCFDDCPKDFQKGWVATDQSMVQITPAPDETTDCKSLDEAMCYESTECIPSYGPSCPICLDIRYTGCVYSSAKTEDKLLCENTGGVWDSTWDQKDAHSGYAYSGYNCACPIPDGVLPYHIVFTTEKGCINQAPVPSIRDICENNGGYWNAKSECENIDATACDEMNGNYDNCASPCRYAARKEGCEKINNYCVQLCTIQ